MWLKLTWVDNRIRIITTNTTTGRFARSTSESVLFTTPSNITLIALENSDILDQIWVPQVLIPHQKLSNRHHGPPFVDDTISIVLKEQDVWVDLWSVIKPTITCPMSFNWFPFDQQSCQLIIRVRRFSLIITTIHISGQQSPRAHVPRKSAQCRGLRYPAFPEHPGGLPYQYFAFARPQQGD